MDVLPETRLRPYPHVAGKTMDGELVAINLRTGLYYSSTGVGPVIWQLMEAGHSSEDIARTIADHYSVPEARTRGDVTAFLERLVADELVEPADMPAGGGDTATLEYASAYEAPTLTSFNDMEQAFALDPPLQA